jgi:hypothetical protein
VRNTPPPTTEIMAGLPQITFEQNIKEKAGIEGRYATSNPRFASGGYSVYLRILLSNSHVKLNVSFPGIES